MKTNLSRVYTNLVIGTFWLIVAGWMYFGKVTNNACVAVVAILGCMFYWAAFKIFKNPHLQKNNKNLMQKISDPNYNKMKKKK